MRKSIAQDLKGREIAAGALHMGGFVRSGMSIAANVAGNCERPVPRELLVRPTPDKADPHNRTIQVNRGESGGYNLDYLVRCRNCERCRSARRALWAARAAGETLASVRTWFGTLTLSPEAHYKMLLLASRRLSTGGTRLEDLSNDEQFRERHAEISRELTLWLKRVRKNSGAPLRVLIVVEKHESGLPHYHVLLHENDVERPVTYRQLANAWPHGFVKFKLIDTQDRKPVWYVTKYLAKDACARVRASVDYGNPPFPRNLITARSHNGIEASTAAKTSQVLAAVDADFPCEKTTPKKVLQTKNSESANYGSSFIGPVTG